MQGPKDFVDKEWDNIQISLCMILAGEIREAIVLARAWQKWISSETESSEDHQPAHDVERLEP